MAELYGVETKVLNQAVKHNIGRYPEDFMFQLDRKDVFFLKSQQVSANEYNADLRSQIVTLKGSTTGSDTEEIIIETSLRSQIVTYEDSQCSVRNRMSYCFTIGSIGSISQKAYKG
ncbi:MAG: ORF6N domain-containing protein [Bacteroidales bacterium]|nr:ORF6N domain-containing protein [Bacteroidales bacterium]